MKINYIIYSPPYNANSGGYSALHYLSECLHKIEVNSVYITTNITNPRWHAQPLEIILNDKSNLTLEEKFLKFLIQIRTWFKIPTRVRTINRTVRRAYPNFVWKFLDRENTVVIYAENEPGNPLEARYIARWIMMNPKDDLADTKYSADEHLFLYNDFYTVSDRYKNQIKGVLTSIDMNYHLQTYKNFGFERKGGAYIIRKGINKPHDKHPKEFRKIDDILMQLSDKEKAEYFNGIKTFISYDPATFISVQAALCGCEVIVIPDEEGEFSLENMKQSNRIHGVAYGLDDLAWARETMHLLKPSMEETNTKSLETVVNFKHYWERFLRH